METPKRRWTLWHWAALACTLTALLSGGMVVRDMIRSASEREANQALSQRVQKARTRPAPRQPDPDPAAVEEELPDAPLLAPSGRLLAYDGLWEENHDLAGWLTIDALDVDLPVLFTPEDPEHYLHRGFDGSYAYSGCLFLGEDWTPEGSHAIIYGHNMKDGGMFGNLDRYKSREFALLHPTLRFDTLTEEREYAVAAAFYAQAYSAGAPGGFRYYQYTDLSEEAVFDEYLRQVREAALYDTGAEIQFGDRLLTLSTCSYHRKNGRFVVVAVQLPADQKSLPDSLEVP